jgi:ubiquinone/menaquinone biosynthesis C-methylase UbiE
MNLSTTIRMIFNALSKPKQHILIGDIPTGHILDIGGGGEGVIAQAGGTRVTAIDKYMSEIREAREKAMNAHWMAADATQLPCKNDGFDAATMFFSAMYMPNDIKEKVFKETHRILQDSGELWIWDVNMRQESQVFAIRLQVKFNDTLKIKTIYGVKAKDQSAASMCAMLLEAGFEAEVVTQNKHWFLIKARK